MTEIEDVLILVIVLLAEIVLPVVLVWAFFKYDMLEKIFQWRKKLYKTHLRRREEMLTLKEMHAEIIKGEKDVRKKMKEYGGERGITKLVKGFANMARNLEKMRDRKKGRFTMMDSLTRSDEESTEEIIRDGNRILEGGQ